MIAPVPTLRFDVTTGDWVAYPVGRGDRPHDFEMVPSMRPSANHDPRCPFCMGQEELTPETVDSEPDPEALGAWSVRVFRNRYPALDPSAPNERTNHGALFREMGGRGVHEVVVESPDHSRSLALLGAEQTLRVLRVLHRRNRALSQNPALEVVQIFKNHGQRAGSSLPHPHLQILGAPVLPRQLRTKYAIAAEYYHAHGESLYTDILKAEQEMGLRVVVANEHFVAFAPFASRVPYEMWIVPKAPTPSFGHSDSSTLPALGEVLSGLLYRLHVALSDAAYNLTINSAPRRHVDEPDFVWHIEILPRISAVAGFEFATGMAINTVLPEQAADRLRGIWVPE